MVFLHCLDPGRYFSRPPPRSLLPSQCITPWAEPLWGTSRLNKANPRPACSPVTEWTRRSLSSAVVTWLLPAWAFLPEGWNHGPEPPRGRGGGRAPQPGLSVGCRRPSHSHMPEGRGCPPRGGFSLRIISLNTQKWKDLGKNLPGKKWAFPGGPVFKTLHRGYRFDSCLGGEDPTYCGTHPSKQKQCLCS